MSRIVLVSSMEMEIKYNDNKMFDCVLHLPAPYTPQLRSLYFFLMFLYLHSTFCHDCREITFIILRPNRVCEFRIATSRAQRASHLGLLALGPEQILDHPGSLGERHSRGGGEPELDRVLPHPVRRVV